jgi:hypothetical protein
MRQKMSTIFSDGRRFVVAGIFNSFLSVGLYQLLMFMMSPTVAYTLTWIIGLALVSIIYPTWVFSAVKQNFRNSTITVGVYMLSFLIGSTVIFLSDIIWPGNRLSVFVAVLLSATLNFFVLRIFLR